MGNSQGVHRGNEGLDALEQPEPGSVKRRLSDSDEEETQRQRIEDENLTTPKKKKLKTTSSYIFETLFINGENSDITIRARGKSWNLHKVYICQAKYFSSMFSGSWKESSDNLIDLSDSIPDENIDEEAISLVFGSLYKDDVIIKPTIVVNVLAAATFFGLEGLINQCNVVMNETTNSQSVCSFYHAGGMYGQQEMQQNCLNWLERNLMTFPNVEFLKEVTTEIMAKLVPSSGLFVMQVEMDLYSLLKKWLFLQYEPTFEGNMKELTVQTEAHFKALASVSVQELLDTAQGCQYACVFKSLRLQHILNDIGSSRIIEEDKIIPKTWLLPVYRRQWLQMLRVEQGTDKGPDSKDYDVFPAVSLRCGRTLHRDGDYCWRWTGYNYGIDLLVSFSSRLIIFKRNTHSQSSPGAVSLQSKRNLIYNVTVATFDSLGHTKFSKTTGSKKIVLGKDEEAVIMGIDRNWPFPLHVSCNFLLYTPKHSSRSPSKASTSSEGKN